MTGRFYVYHLIDPRDGKPFYVGKGQRTRGNDHVKNIATHAKDSQHPKDQRIREIIGAGLDVEVKIVERFTLEADALEFEKQQISSLEGLTNILSGYTSAKAAEQKEAADITPKQDAFAQRFLELGNASEAYRQAYDAENMSNEAIWVEASRLLDNPKVALRVKELKALHMHRHNITVDSITEELIEDREFARQQGQASAAISATVHKAKLHGLMVEKQEVTGKDGKDLIPEQLSDLDLARRIAFVLSKASAEAGD